MKKRLLYTGRYKQTILIMGIIMLVCLVFPIFVFNAHSAPVTKPNADNPGFWLWSFLGRLHPLLVHFPVSLLVMAAGIEIFTIKNFNSNFRPAIGLLLNIGAISAVISVVCGLLLNATETFGSDSLQWHQWTGISVAALAIPTAYIHFKVVKGGKKGLINLFRGCLFFTAIGVGVAGHLGSNITHGNQYLSTVLPWSDDYKSREKTKTTLIALRTKEPVSFTADQQLEVYTQVKTIFAHNCYSCHGAEK